MFYFALLILCAFWLGACPFSVWIGQWLLGKDIRDYGDGNPGAVNVFRAGGRKSGFLAIFLDVAKGVPFVVLAHSFFGLSEAIVLAVALSAILGHAFSPLLHLRGGKSVAVTFGVLLALPQHWPSRCIGLSNSYWGKLMGIAIYAMCVGNISCKTL